MITLPVVSLFLAATFRGITADESESKAYSNTGELGKGINLRKTNLLGDFHEGEASVFEPFPSTCFINKKLHYSGSNFDYYASTKAFYSKMAVGAGLDASLQSTFTLGATLSSVVQKADSKESKVSGMSLNVRALTEKILVEKDCLDVDETTALKKSLVKDLERLPLTFEKPWLPNSWKPYDVFINKYGSHVITSVTRGASIRQTTFAESSKSYSQRDFQVKSCVSLAGPTSIGKVGVEACANVSKSEISNVTNMNTADKLIVRGGTKETRNALRKQRTEELIEKFLNEAGESDAAVEHTFRAVWKILQSRFEIGSDNYIRAINIQYYYLGYLNYGCHFKESGGVHIQKFDYTRGSYKESPEFECSLAAQGCYKDRDCHYKPIWCSCYGKSCVRHKSVKQDTGNTKLTGYANTDEGWGWYGCGWKLAGSICACYNADIGQRKVAWTMPSRDAPRKGASHFVHQTSMNPNKDHLQHPYQEDQNEDKNQGEDRDAGSGSGSGPGSVPRGMAPDEVQDPEKEDEDQGREAQDNIYR